MNASDYTVSISPLSAAEGGGFVAYVADLPGCMSDGETPEEALRNAYGAIESWVEAAEELGRVIPEPTAALKSA